MNFYSMRDLRTESKTMWADLDRGDEVVLVLYGLINLNHVASLLGV